MALSLEQDIHNEQRMFAMPISLVLWYVINRKCIRVTLRHRKEREMWEQAVEIDYSNRRGRDRKDGRISSNHVAVMQFGRQLIESEEREMKSKI